MGQSETGYASRGLTGLTLAEVEERVRAGKVNAAPRETSRSFWHIFRANAFNRFNAILGTLFVVILLAGAPLRDALFGGVLLVNTLIGMAQELRAKVTLDRLSLLVAPRARVLRSGEVKEIPQEEVVLDEVLVLRQGDQLVADGEVLEADGLEIDESMLTGESVPVPKKEGDEALSGSIVTAGAGMMRVNAVGADAYARKLASEARRFKPASSELREGINRILLYITWVMVPAGLLLLYSQLKSSGALQHVTVGTVRDAVPGVVAGLVGMVPEGLVLLTSMAFAVAAVTLASRKVLVQELPAVEGLARVDVVCVDKTGTLTEGDLVFGRLEPLGSAGPEVGLAQEALGAMAAAATALNPTLEAIAAAFSPPRGEGWEVAASVPFSSARKWSSVSFASHGTWILGAPEVMLAPSAENAQLLQRVSDIAGGGVRVLLLGHSPGVLEKQELPADMRPAALLVLEEKVREDAPETMRYFSGQGVRVKVISGDNPATVAAVAQRAGVGEVGLPVDARSLPDEGEELEDWMEHHNVFGRVVPHQKRDMVRALQSRGHTVAMTGDGVNDVLALKDADIGIAMGSGAPATKAVAELVLLDGRFSTMPGVVAEGRRVIANMERVANFFLTKTTYATLLAVLVGVMGWKYPLLPRQLTLVSAVTIGIPAFILSFAPTSKRYRPGFVGRVLWFAVPAGCFAAASIVLTYAITKGLYPEVMDAKTGLLQPSPQSSMMVTLAVSVFGLWILGRLARPLRGWRLGLLLAMVGLLALALVVPGFRHFLALQFPAPMPFLLGLGLAADAVLCFEYSLRLIARCRWARARRPHE